MYFTYRLLIQTADFKKGADKIRNWLKKERKKILKAERLKNHGGKSHEFPVLHCPSAGVLQFSLMGKLGLGWMFLLIFWGRVLLC